MPVATERDYYRLLGVPEKASQDEIRKAYLKLARQYHPDKTGGDKAAEEKLKAVNEAYDTLKNPEKRKEYDEARAARQYAGPQFGQGFGARPRGAGTQYHTDASGLEGSFEDIFGDIFGGGFHTTRQRGPEPGNDVEVSLPIALQEAADGVRKTIRIPRNAACTHCGGSGAAPGTAPQTCPDCGGSGQSRQQTGAYSISRACRRCQGQGAIVTTPCPSCGGKGTTKQSQTVTVNIPPGADTGTRLRLAGQGEPGTRGGPNGDLYVVVKMQPHPLFERQGADIQCDAPVSFTDAALGAKVRVPTLKGEAELKIPPGTQSGATFRMRGLGLPSRKDGAKGDQLVRVDIEVPNRLSREQKRLLEELRKQETADTYPRRKAFMRRKAT